MRLTLWALALRAAALLHRDPEPRAKLLRLADELRRLDRRAAASSR